MSNSQILRILSYYSAENPGIKQNLIRLLNHGALKGTGKIIMYSVDQGFEVGPDKVFSGFSHGYGPWFHFKLACAGGVNAIVSPLGMLEASIDEFLGKIPTILKINSNNRLAPEGYLQAITSSVDDALRLGCIGIGFTIYPGSEDGLLMFEQLAEIAKDAKSKGLLVVVWAYPKGPHISKEEETSIDLVSYAVHMASLLGAHIIKAKVPSPNIWNKDLQSSFQSTNLESLPQRIQHIRRSAFAKKRIVLFSGGDKINDASFLKTVKDIALAGGVGSMIGRNFFQRSFTDGLSLIENVANIYKSHPQKKRIDDKN